MAYGMLLTGVLLFGFTGAGGSSDSQLAFNSVVYLVHNIMYGALFCYALGTFPAPLRGARCCGGRGLQSQPSLWLFASIIYIYGGNNASVPIYVSDNWYRLCAAYATYEHSGQNSIVIPC